MGGPRKSISLLVPRHHRHSGGHTTYLVLRRPEKANHGRPHGEPVDGGLPSLHSLLLCSPQCVLHSPPLLQPLFSFLKEIKQQVSKISGMVLGSSWRSICYNCYPSLQVSGLLQLRIHTTTGVVSMGRTSLVWWTWW